jgi:DNA processing protein
LHYKGDIARLVGKTLAVVGSRRMSSYGKLCVEKILSDLCGTDAVIVSGFSQGIDLQAHVLSLKYKLPTVAVLPWGIELHTAEYPLIEKIIDGGGCILSEYPGTCTARKWFFLRRNLLVACLAETVLVVEAAEKSGSLITAQYALKLGRPVFAVPGDIFREQSRGIYQLLESSARLCTSGHSLKAVLQLELPKSFSTSCSEFASVERNTLCQSVRQSLEVEPSTVDVLCQKLAIAVPDLLVALSMLEFDGVVKESGGVYYAR